MNCAVAYTRQSRARNEDDGDSLSCAMQAQQIRQWAAAHGYEVTRVYEDQDISGRTDNRPAFQRMLADVRERRDVQAVITYKYSRFARNVRVFANGHGELQDRGVALLSATESGDTRMIQVSALMADWYSTDLSDYVSAAVRQKQQRGGWHGHAPIGYVRDSATQRLVPDPVLAIFVAEVFDRFVGGQTMMDIVRWIKTDPAMTEIRALRAWSYHAIARLLTRRAYLGHTPGMEHAHPPIVDQATFDAAASLIVHAPRRLTKVVSSPLEGLLTCGACGAIMHLHNVRDTRSPHVYTRVWRCASRKAEYVYAERAIPHQRSFRADWVEDAVRDRLERDLANQVPVADALRAARQDAHSDATERRRATLTRQRTKAQAGRDRLLGLFRDGRIDADRWEAADRDSATELGRIDVEVANLPDQPDPIAYGNAANRLSMMTGLFDLSSTDSAERSEIDADLRRFLVEIGAQISIDGRPTRSDRIGITRPTVTIHYADPYARLIGPS